MEPSHPETAIVREVGPRDGLQAAKSIMPTEAKLAWIEAMARAGVSEMEVASFVPPAVLPQMADAREVTARAKRPGLRVVALAPNLRRPERRGGGGRSYSAAGLASEAHSRANVRKKSRRAGRGICRRGRRAKTLGAARPLIEAGISTAFGCPLQGIVPEADVMGVATALAEAGADRVALADTLGYAAPSQVRRLLCGLCVRKSARRAAAIYTCTTRSAWRSPMRWLVSNRACAASTARSAGSAAARSRRAR